MCSPAHADPPQLAELARSAAYRSTAIEIIAAIGDSASADAVLSLFTRAVEALGVNAGVFMSYIRDDATRASYRALHACDPVWASLYAEHGWFETDPWLRHASHDTEPVRSSELQLISSKEHAFVEATTPFGFASYVVSPAPTCAGQSRIGVLCLGSSRPGFFDDEGYTVFRVLARALAMELHRWLFQSIRRELLMKSRLTTADIDLLRHENAGLSSKAIGNLLNIEAKTIDCRFQRISAKLEAPNRRAAVRIARLYGLL